jgi:putative ABC transport system permease protein
MTLNDTIDLSLRNLSQAKLRTALTTLGVSIGIASLAGMISLGVGLQDQVVGRLMQSGVFGSITVTTISNLPGPFAQLGSRGVFARGRSGNAGRTDPGPAPPAKLDDDALKRLAALDNVRDVYPNIRVPVQMSIDEFSRPVLVAGVPLSQKGVGAFQALSYGRFFTGDAETACIISLDIAKRVNDNAASLIGKNLTLSYAAAHASAKPTDGAGSFQAQRVDLQCPIVGIVERDIGPMPPAVTALSPLSGVIVPMGLAKTVNAEIIMDPQSLLRDPLQPRSYGTVTVKVKQAQYTQDVEDRLKSMGYSAFSVDDAMRGAKNAFIILDIFLSLIGSIALAVSSLGIVNTMVMSILERTREIGIMKAIGASNDDVRRIFLVEASVIGLLGGLLGIALGWSVGRLINFVANLYIRSQGGSAGQLFSLPVWLIASAIAFSILVSLVAGSYPASRAARLDPIQALRHD